MNSFLPSFRDRSTCAGRIQLGAVALLAILTIAAIQQVIAQESADPPTAEEIADFIEEGLSASSDTADAEAKQAVAFFNRPTEVSSGGYIGSQACQECHEHNHATWHESYHRSMTQVATTDSVLAPTDGTQLVTDDVTFRFEHRGDQVWTLARKNDAVADAPPIERQIVLVTGSHHMQVYWLGRPYTSALDQFPQIYLLEEQRWIPRQAAFLRPPEWPPDPENGRWNRTCIRCHSTHGRMSDPLETKVAEFGISCEACHGPGERHVAAARQQADDLEIVNPSRLSAERSSQVCGQCHGVTQLQDQQEQKHWQFHGFRFRPGDDLDQSGRFLVRHNLHRRQNELYPNLGAGLRPESKFWECHFWSDGMVRVSGRDFNGLIESPCFAHADEERKMSCLSCHQLHQSENDPRPSKQWANDLLGHGMRTNQACTQCHDKFRDEPQLAAHTHHLAGSSGSLCYNCHMPYTSYGLMKAIRSHQVGSPSVAESLETGRPNACNQCHMDKTLAWTANHLEQRHGIAQPELSADEQSLAATVLWTLKGDAGQRVLMAWTMGWPAAREASQSEWTVPYLLQLMGDKYDTVRFIAHRSLRREPGFEEFKFDFMAPPRERAKALAEAARRWMRGAGTRNPDPQLLINDHGTVNAADYNRLLSLRNRRRVLLTE